MLLATGICFAGLAAAQFRIPIGAVLSAHDQSTPRNDPEVLAEKHNPAVRHISHSIRLDDLDLQFSH